MKMISLAVLSLFAAFTMPQPAAAAQSGVRETLIKSAQTSYVYAIDNDYTLVIPKTDLIKGGTISDAFVKEFAALCPAGLDRIETIAIEDPDTGKVTNKTKLSEFAPDEADESIKEGVRCKNDFTIVNIFGKKQNGYFRTKSFIMKHETPQHLAYKTDAIAGEITLPPEGPVKFIKEKNSDGVMNVFGGLFGSKKYPFDSEDLLQYLVAACDKFKLNPRFIIKSGKLKEVSAYEAMAYAFSNNTAIDNKQFYFVAEGDKPFIVSVKRDKGASVPESTVTLNKGTDGLTFTPLQKPSDKKTAAVK